MSFDVNWDIDHYRDPQERDDFWHLRKTFMEKWKQTYPEEKVVYLARAFANIAIMGSTYPIEVMHQVAWMSKDLKTNMTNEASGNDTSTNSTTKPTADKSATTTKISTKTHDETITHPQQSLATRNTTPQEVKTSDHLNLLIRDVNKSITPNEFNLIQNAILGGSSCYSQISFPSIWTESGCVGLTCANKSTKDWIEKEIHNIVPWPGAKLIFVNDSVKILQNDSNTNSTVNEMKDEDVVIIENDHILIDLTEADNIMPTLAESSDVPFKNSSDGHISSTGAFSNGLSENCCISVTKSSSSGKALTGVSKNRPTSSNSRNPPNKKSSINELEEKKARRKIKKQLKKERKEIRLKTAINPYYAAVKNPPKPLLPTPHPNPLWYPPDWSEDVDVSIGLSQTQVAMSADPRNKEVQPYLLPHVIPPLLPNLFRARNLCVEVTTDGWSTLSVEQATAIRKKLEQRLQEHTWSPLSTPVRFRGEPAYSKGVIKLWCEDKYTLNWLLTEVGMLKSPIPKSNLIVRQCEETEKLVDCTLFIPDMRDDTLIRTQLAAQNRNVDVGSWKVSKVERQLMGCPPGTLLSISIPWDDIIILKLQNLRMYWLLGSIHIEIISEN